MSDYDEIFSMDCYGTAQKEKDDFLIPELNNLISYHARRCEKYKLFLKAYGFSENSHFSHMADFPCMSVNLFKQHEIKSISDDDVFKVMTSSGTTGQAVSKIFLDTETAKLQSKTLVKILQELIGKKRLPMLIIDAEATVKDRNMFSARTAGIRGLSTFGRDHTYALNDDMSLNIEVLQEFCAKYSKSPVLIFGFTFMVWQYFHNSLKEKNIKVELPDAILIHSGGWKKLVDSSVDNRSFKKGLKEVAGITNSYNFYGMVEQVGSIFMECSAGYLHAPIFSDIIIRDIVKNRVCSHGEKGVVEVISILPRSYPGNVLLTEDVGVIHGEDDCACGKKGKYFSIMGRIPKAEVRGCSDAHAASNEKAYV